MNILQSFNSRMQVQYEQFSKERSQIFSDLHKDIRSVEDLLSSTSRNIKQLTGTYD